MDEKLIINIETQVDNSGLDKGISEINKKVDGVTKEPIEIPVKVDSEKAVESVDSIKKALRSLKEQAASVGEGGVGFDKLTNQAGELQKKLDDVNDQLKVSSQDGLNKFGAQLGLIKNKLFDLDFSGVRKGIEGLGSTVLGLGPATNAAGAGFRTLAGAIAATGIGALVIAVGYLVTHFNEIKNSTGLIGEKIRELTKFFEGLVDKAKVFVEGAVNGFIELYNKTTLVRGVIQSFILGWKTLVDGIVTGAKVAGNAISSIGSAILDIFRGKNPLDSLKQGFKDIEKNLSDFKTNFKTNFNDAVQETLNSKLKPVDNLFGSFSDVAKKEGKKIAEDFKEGVREELKIDLIDIITPIKGKLIKVEQYGSENPVGLNLQPNEIEPEKIEQVFFSVQERFEAWLSNNKEKLNTASSWLSQFSDAVGQIGDAIQNIFEIRINRAENAADREIAALQRTFDMATKGKNLSNAEQIKLENKLAQDKYKIALDTFNKEEKLREKAFKANQAIQIVQAVIGTAQGVVAALSEPFFPLMIARMALAATTGAIQIGVIASQKYQAGQAPTAPSPISVPEPSLPNSGTSESSGPDKSFQAAQFFGLGGKQVADMSMGYQKVIVTEGDISGVQRRVNVIEEGARFL